MVISGKDSILGFGAYIFYTHDSGLAKKLLVVMKALSR
jgi:hypothetical protein